MFLNPEAHSTSVHQSTAASEKLIFSSPKENVQERTGVAFECRRNMHCIALVASHRRLELKGWGGEVEGGIESQMHIHKCDLLFGFVWCVCIVENPNISVALFMLLGMCNLQPYKWHSDKSLNVSWVTRWSRCDSKTSELVLVEVEVAVDTKVTASRTSEEIIPSVLLWHCPHFRLSSSPTLNYYVSSDAQCVCEQECFPGR